MGLFMKSIHEHIYLVKREIKMQYSFIYCYELYNNNNVRFLVLSLVPNFYIKFTSEVQLINHAWLSYTTAFASCIFFFMLRATPKFLISRTFTWPSHRCHLSHYRNQGLAPLRPRPRVAATRASYHIPPWDHTSPS